MLLPETANKNLNAKYAVPSLGLQIPQTQAIVIVYVFIYQNLIVSLLLKTPQALTTGRGETFDADQDVSSLLVGFHSKRRVMQDAGSERKQTGSFSSEPCERQKRPAW